MSLDVQIVRVKELIQKREEIDGELSAILGATPKARKPQACSKCGQEGHSARTCTQQSEQPYLRKHGSALIGVIIIRTPSKYWTIHSSGNKQMTSPLMEMIQAQICFPITAVGSNEIQRANRWISTGT